MRLLDRTRAGAVTDRAEGGRVEDASLGARAVEMVGGPSAICAIACTMVADLIGCWARWHLHGGFKGAQRFGCSEAAIYRKTKRFRRVFHAHPDEYEFTGITIDPAAYWADGGRRRQQVEADGSTTD